MKTKNLRVSFGDDGARKVYALTASKITLLVKLTLRLCQLILIPNLSQVLGDNIHTIPLSGTQKVRMMQVISMSAGYEFALRKLILLPRLYTVCSARTKRVEKAGYPWLLAERKSSNFGLTSDEWTSTTFIF